MSVRSESVISGFSMENKSRNGKEYNPPEIKDIQARDFLDKLGSNLSCSGYGGAVYGCE